MDIEKVSMNEREENLKGINVDPVCFIESEEIDLYMQMSQQCAGNFVN